MGKNKLKENYLDIQYRKNVCYRQDGSSYISGMVYTNSTSNTKTYELSLDLLNEKVKEAPVKIQFNDGELLDGTVGYNLIVVGDLILLKVRNSINMNQYLEKMLVISEPTVKDLRSYLNYMI